MNYQIDFRDQSYEDAIIAAFKDFAPRVLRYATNRLGGSDNFEDIYKKRIESVRKSAKAYEVQARWYQTEFLPVKEKLEAEQD